MKRKIEEKVYDSQVARDSNEETNVNKKPRSLNLKSVCTITQTSELSSGFCLQSTNEYVLLRSKNEINLMKFEKSLGNHLTRFRLSSTKFPCTSYNVVETLKVSDKKLFNISTHNQKNDIMLDPHLNPRCVQKNSQIVKALLSPSSINQTPILACLSSHGSLEVFKLFYDEDNEQNSLKTIAELCEIRRTQFSLGTTYTKLEKLQEIFKDLSFRNFDWCPEFIGSSRFLAAITKTNELVIFSMNFEGEVVIQHNKKFESVTSCLKWFVVDKKHYLIIASSKGDLTQFEIKLSDLKIDSLDEKNNIKGTLNIPISHIEVDYYNDSILVLCVKAHSLELFLINNKHISSLTKYVGLSITGIVKSSLTHAHYLVTSLCNKIYFMDLSISDNDMKISSYETVENSVNSDIISSKYSAYGITASKNKVLIFIALYPRIMFDHLALKQPVCVSVNIFSTTDPYKMILQNQSLKLTELYDCVEAVRHIATNNLTTLAPLESMTFKIGLNEDFLYYLKVQLISSNASMAYYQTRSGTDFEIFKSTDRQMRLLIETINAYFLLKSIISRKEKPSELTLLSLHCLKLFIERYLQNEPVYEPMKTAKETLADELKSLLLKCKLSSDVKLEQCNYCQEKLDEGLVCCNNHQLARCIITKLQLPLTANNFCSNCLCCIIDFPTLKIITKKEDFFCPFCDQQFFDRS